MNHKGIKLKEITTPQVFDPPKNMLVWDNTNSEPILCTVYAVIRLENGTTEVIGSCCQRWLHCAVIPEEPKPRRATNRELAKWLAQGNGQVSVRDISTLYHYDATLGDNGVVSQYFKVRKWDDTDWHEPTIDNMDIEDK